MTVRNLLPAIASIVLLAACEARFGNDAAPVAENATAAGRSEQGKLTVEAPGFNLSVDIPEGISSRAEIDEDNWLVYPGSTFAGMHVQGGREQAQGDRDGEVEMRFTTADLPDRVVAWYRDPARGQDVRIATAERRGADFVITGAGRDGERFTVTVAPRPGGGSEARLLIADRN